MLENYNIKNQNVGLKNVDIKNIDKSTLKDINDVRINLDLDKDARMVNYVEQIGNPNCYLDNEAVVILGFADTEATLEDRLRSYIYSLG